MTISKIYPSAGAAIEDIEDRAVIAIAGFGQSHRYPELVPALIERETKELCVVANSLGANEFSLGSLIEHHRVKRVIISISSRADDQIASGELEVELVPQGTLVERLRAGGAGIAGFYTKTGVGTPIADGKDMRYFDGDPYLFERAIQADFSFIRANAADRFGNLRFRGAGRNFNPSFAKGGRIVIAEVEEIVDGEINPEEVGLPGIFVTRVVPRRESRPVSFRPPRQNVDVDEPQLYNEKPGWTRAEMAQVAAELLPEPSYVNLGLGIPTLVSNYIDTRDVVLHSENGMLGYGPYASAENFDPDIYNAGSSFVNLLPGASFFDSVTSFEMVRGGRVNVVVLGALQVDERADLANWATQDRAGGTIGGAMDLVSGNAMVMVVMTHRGSRGEQKLVSRCSYPLTGSGCVDVIVTDLAVFRRREDNFVLERLAPGFNPDEIAGLTEMNFAVATELSR